MTDMNKISQAEAHCTALKKTLQERDPSQAALSAELANVRAQLDSTEQRLASYEADAADSRSMESQLKDSLEQIKTLKLKEVVAEQVSA
jgi:septal ring factor EnvC (AmiA/AmiB activator)